MSSFHNNALVGASGQAGYQIERSLRFNSPDSAYLNRTPASASNRKTWTWSGWTKRAKTGVDETLFAARTGATTPYLTLGIRSTDDLRLESDSETAYPLYKTNAVFRDCSAWYHIVVALDMTQATSTERLKVYVNGVLQTAASYNVPAQNTDLAVNSTVTHHIGQQASGNYLNGYLTEVHFIDGQALTPSSFGETDTITGVWKPKKYAGTYGTNGFYLKFADNSGTTSTTLGKDSSGNSNNWTPNNFSVTAGAGNDSMIDTPTPYADGGNGRGNYATWNPLDRSSSTTLTNGNLNATSTVADWRMVLGSFGMTSGKWYWELTVSGTIYNLHGIAKATVNKDSWVGADANGWGYYAQSGTYNSGSYINTSTYASYTAGDTISVAFDADSGKIWWAKNGTWQGSGNPAAGTNAAYTGLTSGPYFPAASHFSSTNSDANFGQRAFAYTPPSGFLALNTQNLPEPSIKKPSSYFDIKLYSGTNANQSITGLGFSPDLIWFKNRTGTAWHGWFDSVRGRAAGISSNVTDAESTSSAGNDLVSFDANGFSLGPVQNWNSTNGSGNSIVAWCWDESATPGFDIVTYTGNGGTQNISHTLGVVPRMIIIKDRSAVTNWYVYHTSLGTSQALLLSSANAAFAPSPAGVSAVSSSNFTLGGARGETNTNAENYVAYLWSEVAGFSKFGSYTGNGSSDGPFVYCGFRPRFILFKNTTNYNWQILDTARADYNQGTVTLFPNLSNAENTTATQYDILSNGFKIRTSDAGSNGSGNSIIFAAFAESPFKYSLAR